MAGDDGGVPDGERSQETRYSVTALGDRDSLEALEREGFQGCGARGSWAGSHGLVCRHPNVGRGVR